MSRTSTLLLAAIALLSGLGLAADRPVAGKRLEMRASLTRPTPRTLRLRLKDATIAAPFSDPTLGAALVISGGAAAGQCFAEIALDPAGWTPLRHDGASFGWRYRKPSPGTEGVRSVVVRRGEIIVGAQGAALPCGLTAAQRVPLSVELRVSGDRYCGAFGGTVVRNEPGRFIARDANAPTACPKRDLTVANLNILHGIFCPGGSASCRQAERIDLLYQWIAGSGCPDVVTFQEVWNTAVPLIEAQLATVCPFPYNEVFVPTNMVDDAIILTRYPAAEVELRVLYKNFRNALYARLDHPLGPVDVVTTHLAAGSDGANQPCAGDCPLECVTAGAATVRECQSVQVAAFAAERHDVSPPAVVTGDFNDEPGSFVYTQFTGRGWVDTYLAAGNPECNPGTGVGCTAGRDDDDLSELESPASNEVERIDFTFLIPPAPGSLCTAALDTAADSDGDGTATRIFTDDPNPFAPTCGPAPDPICWPSDHEGSEADVNCG